MSLFIIVLASSIVAFPISLLIANYLKRGIAKDYWDRRQQYEDLTGKPYDN